MAGHRGVRSRSACAVLALCVAAVAACSPAAPDRVDGRFPVTVTHRFGETVVPAAPRRVVTFGSADQEVLLALDIVPVGRIPSIGPDPSWRAGRIADLRRRTGAAPPMDVSVQPGGKDFGPPSLRPDLITEVDYPEDDREEYDRLGTIAPTVGPPVGGRGHATWQEVTRTVGLSVGRPVTVQRLITVAENRVAAARARHPELARHTAACVTAPISSKGMSGVYADSAGPLRGCSQILADLGFREIPGLHSNPDDPIDTVLKEDIAAARPDVVILNDDAVHRDNLLYYLPPGQRLATLDDDQLAALGAGVLGLPAEIDGIADELARALR